MAMPDETLFRMDPAMRVAMKIAHESRIPDEVVRSWYGAVVLGEMTMFEFFTKVREVVKDEGLGNTLDALMTNLPKVHQD